MNALHHACTQTDIHIIGFILEAIAINGSLFDEKEDKNNKKIHFLI
jgi:hypothetical protein